MTAVSFCFAATLIESSALARRAFVGDVMRQSCIAVACALIVGPAAAELVEVKLSPGESVEKEFTLAPGKFAELCSALKRGQVASWQFRADATVDFNIHYHVGQGVEYPEKRAGIAEASGRLIANLDESYCWMWTNRSTTPVLLKVRLNDLGR